MQDNPPKAAGQGGGGGIEQRLAAIEARLERLDERTLNMASNMVTGEDLQKNLNQFMWSGAMFILAVVGLVVTVIGVIVAVF